MTTSSSTKKYPSFLQRSRRIILLIHMLLGLFLGLWFSVIGVTGSVLVWRGEFAHWEIRRRYPLTRPATKTPTVTIAAAMQTIQAAHPEITSEELANIGIPYRSLPYYSFTLGSDKKTQKTYFIDPYTAKIHAPFNKYELTIEHIKSFHKELLLGMRGYLLNSFFLLMSIPLVILGLWAWWPSSRAQRKTNLAIERNAPLRKRLGNMHRVLGCYFYALLILLIATGSVRVYQHIAKAGFGAYIRNEKGTSAKKKSPENNAAPAAFEINLAEGFLNADDILAKINSSHPEWQAINLKIPLDDAAQYEVTFKRNYGIAGEQSYLVNPHSGALAEETIKSADFNSVNKALHLGVYGSYLTKVLYTLAGLAPLGLFLTGVRIWLLAKKRS